MATERMSAREEVVGSNCKSSIMETSGVGIGSATPGLTLSTISHQNSIKTLNPIMIGTGSVGHSKLVPFIIASALIMPTTTSTSSTIAFST